MEAFTPSRAQSPAQSRARHAAGELRLHAILRAILLSLLSVLLGRRRPWLYTSATHIDAEWLEAYALPFPQAESPRPILVRSVHDGTHLVCEHPILWVIGPGPCRGMRPISRATPVARRRTARAPPPGPNSAPMHPNQRQIAPRQGTMARARRPAAYPRTSPTTRARTRSEFPGR